MRADTRVGFVAAVVALTALLACAGSTSAPPPVPATPMPAMPTPSAQSASGASAPAGSTGTPVVDPPSAALPAGCRAADLMPPTPREARWLALRASEVFQGQPHIYLTRVGERGPGPLHDAGACPDALGPPGAWSADGRFFAFETPQQSSSLSAQSLVMDVDGRDTPLPRSVPGVFLGWAPAGSRLATYEQPDRLWIWDGERPDAPRSIALPTDATPFFKLAWSHDGRYLAFDAYDQNALYLIDTDADMPRAQAHRGAGPVGDLRWSPGGHRLAYGRGIDTRTLMLVDADAMPAEPRQIAADAVLPDGNFALYTWLDPERILLDDGSGMLRVIALKGGGIETTQISIASDGVANVLPGERCALYEGRCGRDNQHGVCVQSLEPGMHIDAGPIFTADNYFMVAGPLGSPVLLSDPAQHAIFEVDLATQPFATRRITASNRGEQVREVFAVAPGSTPRWAYYSDAYSNAVAPHRPAATVHFWNRITERRFEVDPNELDLAEDGEFSADGALFATSARTSDFPPTRAPLVIQRLGPDEPAGNWTIERFVSFQQLAFFELEWQP